MSDVTQIVIVTLVAAVALGVMVWPLVPGRTRRPPPAKPGCSSCSADHDVKPPH